MGHELQYPGGLCPTVFPKSLIVFALITWSGAKYRFEAEVGAAMSPMIFSPGCTNYIFKWL